MESKRDVDKSDYPPVTENYEPVVVGYSWKATKAPLPGSKISITMPTVRVKKSGCSSSWWLTQSIIAVLVVSALALWYQDPNGMVSSAIDSAKQLSFPTAVSAALFSPPVPTSASPIINNNNSPDVPTAGRVRVMVYAVGTESVEQRPKLVVESRPTLRLGKTSIGLGDGGGEGDGWWRFWVDMSPITDPVQRQALENSTLVEVRLTICGHVRILWQAHNSFTSKLGSLLHVNVTASTTPGQAPSFSLRMSSDILQALCDEPSAISLEATFVIHSNPPELLHARLDLNPF